MEKVKKNPPGRRWFKKLSLKTKWLLSSVVGLLLIGYGIVSITEAAHLKHSDDEISRWFLYGTYSLVVFCAGISIFGQAIVFKSKIEIKKMLRKKEIESSLKKLKPTKMINPDN
jgi:hypothetical protein